MQQHDLAVLLLAKAAQDEMVVAKLSADTDVSDEIIGFHCQQAAEKLLKAVLAENSVRSGKTHNLVRLRKLLEAASKPVPEHLEDIDALNPFAVVFRYDAPDEGDVFDREWARYLVAELREWAETQILGV
jgi:HEPN domain-containing protein